MRRARDGRIVLMANFLLGQIFRQNVNEAISLAEITSFRFPRKIFHAKFSK